jgi:uncharacterized cupredoxin-like copper-binding protein
MSIKALQELKVLLEKRGSRVNLDTTKFYMKVQIVGGEVIKEEVGRFIKVYTIGSGDSRELVWEFIKDGKIITVSNEMWGTVDGKGLIHFKEIDSKN